MLRYLLHVKINPAKTEGVLRAFRDFPEKPLTGVTLHYSHNVFGNWDSCIWFEAKTPDQAADFVLNKIRPIPGVLETLTMPTTSIKEYKNW